MTFSGLCADHDRQIFAPIETATLDLANPEHRFLLAYRATFYELHATVATASQIQTAYLERVELGADPRGVPSPAGIFATQRMLVAWQTWVYKSVFDEAYLAGKFDAVSHDLLELDVAEPTLAACALFSLDGVTEGEDVVRVCLTVLPMAPTRTIALLSYLPSDAGRARVALDRVLAASGAHQKYELSRRVLNHCQNFAISPRFVDSWSSEKRHAILDLYTRTVFRNDLEFENPALTLFA